MTQAAPTGGRKKKGAAGLAIAGGLVVVGLLAMSKRSSAATGGGVFVPPAPAPSSPKPPSTPSSPPKPATTLAEVMGRVVQALATRDPKVMRAEAAKLRAEGWPSQASDLEEAARRLESLQPQPTTPPATPPAPKPPATPMTQTQPAPAPAPKPPAPAPSSPPATTLRSLKQGDTGADVTAWKAVLNAQGYALGLDGSFGSATHKATQEFQTDKGITVDGVVGPETRAAVLKPTILGKRTLQLGSRGAAVMAWETALVADGYKIVPDGNFDETTLAATRDFQTAHGVTPVDGKVGTKTAAAIGTPRKTPPVTTGGLQPAPSGVTPTVLHPDTWRNPLKQGIPIGSDVAEWQLVLVRDGYPVLVDGNFGPDTKAKTIAWQKAHALTGDGEVGPLTRGKIASTSARVAGDVDLVGADWRPFRPVSPLPGILPEQAPAEQVTDDRALAARLYQHLYFAELGAEDRDLITLFQTVNGLNPTGTYGPNTAEALISYGLIPPRPRYWPSKGTLKARASYKAALLAQAKRDQPRRGEWLAAARMLEGN